jgi:hypothetical protein
MTSVPRQGDRFCTAVLTGLVNPTAAPTIDGAVASCEVLAGWTRPCGLSDRQGQLGESSLHPQVHRFLGPELIVSAAEVLDKRGPHQLRDDPGVVCEVRPGLRQPPTPPAAPAR